MVSERELEQPALSAIRRPVTDLHGQQPLQNWIGATGYRRDNLRRICSPIFPILGPRFPVSALRSPLSRSRHDFVEGRNRMAGLEIIGVALVVGTILLAWFRILVAQQAVGLNLRRIELHLDSDISGDDRA